MGCSECSFLSSGGDYPDGYCLWLLRKNLPHVCQSCFCQDGFECDPPSPHREPEFEGQVVKVPCKPKA